MQALIVSSSTRSSSSPERKMPRSSVRKNHPSRSSWLLSSSHCQSSSCVFGAFIRSSYKLRTETRAESQEVAVVLHLPCCRQHLANLETISLADTIRLARRSWILFLGIAIRQVLCLSSGSTQLFLRRFRCRIQGPGPHP